VTWSAPGQAISEWEHLQVRKNTTDRIQFLPAPSGGVDKAFRFEVRKDDFAVNDACGLIGSGWRAGGVGPHEQESNRTIRYEWNTLFEQGFPGSPVDSSGHEVWVLFTQWHQKDPSTGDSPPIAFIIQNNKLRLVLTKVDNTNPDPAHSVEVNRYDLAPFSTGVWHHWRAEIRWALKDGSIKVWHDDSVVQDLAHVQTVFPISPGQLDQPGDSYLKVGLYRKPVDPPAGPWVVWHDEFKRLEQGTAGPLPHPSGTLPMCPTGNPDALYQLTRRVHLILQSRPKPFVDLDLGIRRPEPPRRLQRVGLVLVRLAGLTDDLAIRGTGSPSPAVLGLVDRDLHGSILAPSWRRLQRDIEQPVFQLWLSLGDLSMSRDVGIRPSGDGNLNWPIQRGEVALAIKSAVKHTSCRDLTPHQWGVWHGVEPVDALVLEEITTLLIQPIVRFGDSKGSHKSGMGACQWLVIGHAVILFEPEIFAEHGPMARPRFTAFDKFSDHGGLKRLTRILMLEHPL
jgi:hypothetical protein